MKTDVRMQPPKSVSKTLTPTLSVRKRLRKKMPKGFSVVITEKLGVRTTSISKWFNGDFNSNQMYELIKVLAERK